MPCKHVHAVHTLFEASDQIVQVDEAEEVSIISLPEPDPVSIDSVEGDVLNESSRLTELKQQFMAKEATISRQLEVLVHLLIYFYHF
jgi:hypothetical protein